MAESPKYYPERAKESHHVSKSAETFRSYQKAVIDQIRDQHPTKDLLTHLEGLTSTPQTVDQVLALQILLYRLGFNSKQNIDGIYGNKDAKNSRTMDAVRAFQKAYNKKEGTSLIEDGWFGPKTFEALQKWCASFSASTGNAPIAQKTVPKTSTPSSVQSPSKPIEHNQTFTTPPTVPKSPSPTPTPVPSRAPVPKEKPLPDPLEKELGSAAFGAEFYRSDPSKDGALHITWDITKLRSLSGLAVKSAKDSTSLSLGRLELSKGDYLFPAAYTKEKLVEAGYMKKESNGTYSLSLIFQSATKKAFVRKVVIR